MQPGRYRMFWLGQLQLVDVFEGESGGLMVRTEYGEDMPLDMCACAEFMRAAA